MKQLSFILIFLIPVFLTSCLENRVFEKHVSVKGQDLSYGEEYSIELKIPDTTSVFNLFLNFRHTDSYAYRNIWLKIKTISPSGKISEGKQEIILAEPDGTWTGQCSGHLCYNRVLFRSNVRFEEEGNYSFFIEQDMRVSPISGILDLGLRVEKIN